MTTTCTPPEAPARSAGEQLVLELAEVWHARHARALLLDRDTKRWREAVTGVCDGWAVLYLLLLLREVDPAEAERAARLLHEVGGPVDLPRYVRQWQEALAARVPVGPLLP